MTSTLDSLVESILEPIQEGFHLIVQDYHPSIQLKSPLNSNWLINYISLSILTKLNDI